MNKIYIVSTTCPNLEDAQRIAKELVSAGLVACAQIGNTITSTYIWKNKQYSENEIPLIFKTSINSIEKLEKKLKILHPYECPEFITIQANASNEYAKWVNDTCK